MSSSTPRRKTSRFHLYVSVLLLLLTVPLISASSAAEPGPAGPPSKLERQVNEWVSALSAEEPFVRWTHAAVEIQALGPGTHGWLAVLKADGETVGYLVIHAATDGTYRLGEYGIGPDVLYSPATLTRTLLENGLISSEDETYNANRHYYHPFAALWEVTVGMNTYWVDAKTGDILPFERRQWDKLARRLEKDAAASVPERFTPTVDSVTVQEPFDPYGDLPWLTGSKPLSAQDGIKMQTLIDGGLHLRYVTEPFGDAALYAAAVTGYQRWTEGRVDLALDMEGSRFIPLDMLKNRGRFYE